MIHTELLCGQDDLKHQTTSYSLADPLNYSILIYLSYQDHDFEQILAHACDQAHSTP